MPAHEDMALSGKETLPRVRRTPAARLAPAGDFSFEYLVDAYNQTRADYIVPMPMNPARLREYVHVYDVDLERSLVALEGGRILGLAMLGVRPAHTWITRLGVIPSRRRQGIGQMLMHELVARSRRLGVDRVSLCVIVNNVPAHLLFLKMGFREVRELLVIRRPPGVAAVKVPPYSLEVLNRPRALNLLDRRRSIPSWLDETASLRSATNLAALCITLAGGDRGWLVYQETPLQLARLVLQTEAGDPHRVGLALLHALHARHPHTDTKSENLPLDDPHWPALQEAGYVESFRRIEMRLDTG
jgi:ribosomal protein S18 acetylase RimI-like enzyme